MTQADAIGFFQKTYDVHADSVYRFCLLRARAPEDAQDIVQDTFVKFWDYIARGDEVENPKAFIFQITRNLIIDHYRKQGHREGSLEVLMEDGFDEKDARAENQIEHSAEIELLKKHLKTLDPLYQEAVYLRHFEECSVGEIAQILGESENVISVRIHRGIAKLRERINKDDHGT